MTSKQLKVLAEAGYVTIAEPTGTGGRVKTWVSFTKAGQQAFRDHVQMLQQLAAGVTDPIA